MNDSKVATRVLTLGLCLSGLYLPASSMAVADEWPEALTPVGAQQAGNAQGTIPAWDGGWLNASVQRIRPGSDVLSQQSQPYQVRTHAQLSQALKLQSGSEHLGDAALIEAQNDQPVVVITNENWQEWQHMLSMGHQTLLEQYPQYRMLVYPSRRSAAYPPAYVQWGQDQFGLASIHEQDSLEGVKRGLPFLRPTTGEAVIWNHRLRYQGDSSRRHSEWLKVVSHHGGRQKMTRVIEQIAHFNHLNASGWAEQHPELGGSQQDVNWYYAQKILSPPKDAGVVDFLHDTLTPRRFQSSNMNQGRKVVRVPNMQYDYIPIGSDGMVCQDQLDVFNGNLRRYDWLLLGKRDMLVPYNAHRLNFTIIDADAQWRSLVPQQASMRYEPHRVWVVKATEKTTGSHRIAQRVLYIDEDSWAILMVDLYDKRGNIWRFQEGHLSQLPAVGVPWLGTKLVYDFANQSYLVMDGLGERGELTFNALNPNLKRYQIGSLRRFK